MRRKVAALIAASLVVCSLAFSVAAYAQQSSWASVSSIRDITGNSVVGSGQPLLAGHSYNVTVNIAVPFSQQKSQFVVALNPGVGPSGSQYWYVLTPSYAGFNSAGFTPGSKNVTFSQVQGTLTLSALFSLSPNYTVTQAGSLTLRFELDNFQLITVTVVGGSQVGNVTTTISDQEIQAYQQDYASKSTYISTGKIASSYSAFVSSVLSQAQTLEQLGLPEQATSLLNVLDTPLPAPPSSTLLYVFGAAAGLLAVVVVLLVVLGLRRSSKQGFMKSIAGEVEKDLAGIEVKAAQYDKNLADKLKAIREKLGEIQ